MSFLKRNKITSGLLYGMFVWIIMNIIVLPVTFNRTPIFDLNGFFTGATIVMIAVGLTIAIITQCY